LNQALFAIIGSWFNLLYEVSIFYTEWNVFILLLHYILNSECHEIHIFVILYWTNNTFIIVVARKSVEFLTLNIVHWWCWELPTTFCVISTGRYYSESSVQVSYRCCWNCCSYC